MATNSIAGHVAGIATLVGMAWHMLTRWRFRLNMPGMVLTPAVDGGLTVVRDSAWLCAVCAESVARVA